MTGTRHSFPSLPGRPLTIPGRVMMNAGMNSRLLDGDINLLTFTGAPALV
tara:strand:- start:114 stop:263 length:150 start_codon:yes stop_codon:yes gene_type:complete